MRIDEMLELITIGSSRKIVKEVYVNILDNLCSK
jgi:hypothetical protein